MVKSQTFEFAHSANFRVGIITLLLFFYGRFLSAVLAAMVLLVSYVCYRLISYRRSPEQVRQQPKRFKFLERSVYEQEFRAQHDSPDLIPIIVTSSPLISERLAALMDLIVQNFIQTWYDQVSQSKLFPNSVRANLHVILRKLLTRLASVNLVEFLVYRILPILSTHYSNFVTSSNLHDLMYSMESKLACVLAMDTGIHRGVSLSLPRSKPRRQEKEYFRRIVAKILPLLMTPEENESTIVTTFVREVLACTILANLAEVLCEGDLLNQFIVNLIGSTLQRHKQILRLREASERYTKVSELPAKLPSLSSSITSETYRQWINAIKKCKSDKMLRLLLVAVENAQQNHLSSLSSDSSRDLRRLNQLKEQVDSLLAHNVPSLDSLLSDSKKKHLLREYLRSTKEEYLLDCWTEIEHIKAPLEDVQPTSITLKLKFSNKDEIWSIFDRYFSIESLKISPSIRDAVQAFVYSDWTNPQLYKEARKSLLLLQENIYQFLKLECYPNFLQSEAFADLNVQKNVARSTRSLAFNRAAATSDDSSVDTGKISSAVAKAVESALEKIAESSPNPDQKAAIFPSLDDAIRTNLLPSLLSGLNESSESLKITNNRSSRLFEDCSESDLEETSFDSFDGCRLMHLSDSRLFNLEILLAAPGDLKLEEEVESLNRDIETLSRQSDILVSLTKKAELTNNVSELKILRKSNAGLEREIRSKELQKQQYIVQENENSLFGKSSVRIQSCVLSSSHQHPYALYIIEVQKISSENPADIVAGWIVARRFNQFFELHEYLKRRYVAVGALKFPKKAVSYSNFQRTQQIEVRKPALEQYLKQLLLVQEVCSNPIFRSFLSSESFDLDLNEKCRSKDGIFNRFYQELAPRLPSSQSPTKTISENDKTLHNIREMERELRQFDGIERSKKSIDKPPFIQPIIDLILALFDLGTENWLRGRALLVILQQVLGSTIEKTITSTIKDLFSQEKRVISLLDTATLMLFPNGKFREAPDPRTLAKQLKTRQEAFSVFTVFMDETCSKVFGGKHTSIASANILELLQNDYLNMSLLLKLFDAAVAELFPEAHLTS